MKRPLAAVALAAVVAVVSFGVWQSNIGSENAPDAPPASATGLASEPPSGPDLLRLQAEQHQKALQRHAAEREALREQTEAQTAQRQLAQRNLDFDHRDLKRGIDPPTMSEPD